MTKNEVYFSQFWQQYPKKRSKGDAEKAFKALKVTEEMLAEILKGLELSKKSPDWNKQGGQFIPYPATWLRAKGWEDEFETPIEDEYLKWAQS